MITLNAVKNIGLYDERFCNIGYQEADYFLRAVLLNRQHSSINDVYHKRIHNPCENNVIEDVPSGYMRNDVDHLNSLQYHHISRRMFAYKWMGLIPISKDNQATPYENWDDYIKSVPICAKQYVMYPYFECLLPDLETKYINYSSVYKF